MKKKNIFIGVAWPYVNGELHLGHLAGSLIPADIFARFNRLIGNNVLMASGSDCHGTPITLEAEKRKISPQKVVSLYHPKHKKLLKLYNFSFDIYTKTTTPIHKKVVQDIFIRLLKNRYIYKGISRQYFSQKENRFLPDRYVEGICPYCKFPNARGDQCDRCGKVLEEGALIEPKSKLTGKPVIVKETEHYYFDLPKLVPFLREYVLQHGPRWRRWVYEETLSWLKRGLQPRCITRDINWGVKIPVNSLPKELRIKNTKNKRIYVWFDAVIGYLSASIEWSKDTQKWRNFWYSKENTLHYYFMGKDNLVFHTLFWPAQLYGAYKKIHLPDYPVVNQFLNLEGQPFSKSRGIFVGAKYIGEKYGVDPVRFYLTLIMPENSDSNFSWSEFVKVNNNVLIGILGNFIHRTLKLANHLNNFSKKDVDKETIMRVQGFLKKCKNHLFNCQFKAYTKTIVDIADFGNKYLQQKTPWQLNKNSKDFKKVMTNALFYVLALNLACEPLIPATNKKLSKMLGISINNWPEKGIIQYLKDFLIKIKITNPQPLFKKISPSTSENEKQGLS
jgi:methionyl-tRNA synthetase